MIKRIGLIVFVIALLLVACATPSLPEEHTLESTITNHTTTDELGLPELPDWQANHLYTTVPYQLAAETYTSITTQQQGLATQAQTTTALTTTVNATAASPPTLPTRITTTTEAPPTRPTGIGGGAGSGTAHTRVNISVSRAGLIAMGGAVTQLSHMIDSIGRESERLYTGVPLRNVLQANGVNVNTAPASATVLVTAQDGTTFTLNRAQFTANTTLLAWVEDRGSGDVRQLDRPRLVFPQGLSGVFIQQVVSIQFNP